MTAICFATDFFTIHSPWPTRAPPCGGGPIDGGLAHCTQAPNSASRHSFPEPTRQKLDEGQVVVTFEREPIVRSGHEPALAHSHDLTSELRLSVLAQDVLDHGVGKNQVETPVREGKGTAVKHRVARPRIESPGAQHLADLVAPGHNPLRIGVDVLERIPEEDLAAGADVEHAVLRTGA